MPISFGNIPPDVLLPLFYAEITPAQEPWSPALKLCLIGSANQAEPGGFHYEEGSGLSNVPYLLSGTLATELFGRGSMLARMYTYARSNAPFAEIWGCALPSTLDDANPLNNAFRSKGKIYVYNGGTKTRFGTAAFHIEGVPISFSVQKTDTPAVIAQRIRAAVNAKAHGLYATINMTGSEGDGYDPSGRTVLLTAKYPGLVGNNIAVTHVGCYGRRDSRSKPQVLAKNIIKIHSMGSVQEGSGEATPAQSYAVLQDRQFDVFAAGYWGHNFLAASEDFMDHISGRWAPNRQIYGHIVTGRYGPLQDLYEYLAIEQDPHMTSISIKYSVIPQWCWAAALGGMIATHWSAPPELSRPLQTLELRNICVGSDDDESFTRVEKQTLLAQGGTTYSVDDNGTTRIDRVRTLRKENVYGDPDPSWADAITMFQAMYFVRAMRSRIQGAYPRCALSSLPSGINGFTSPVEIRALVIHEYKRMASLGLVENSDLFARYLICERNAVDRNRVDVLMRPDFVNQLRVVAALVETHLELDASDPTLLQAA